MDIEDFVTAEQAIALKRLGFDWYCDYYWHKEFPDVDRMIFRKALNTGDFNNSEYTFNGCCSAPTLAEAQKWLRKVKNIAVFSELQYNYGKYFYSIRKLEGDYDDVVIEKEEHDSYEEALSLGITECLRLLENI